MPDGKQVQKGVFYLRILVYGDIHLSTRNRAKHISYPDESLHYFEFITEQAEKLDVDCIVGLGDLTYGNFTNLKFRAIFEELLERQIKQTKGWRYELEGNHDQTGAGYSERDFYTERGKIKTAERIVGQHVVVDMLNYGDLAKYTAQGGMCIDQDKSKKHVVLCHDFLYFRESPIKGYGDGYIIEELVGLKGADWIIGGHIHDMLSDKGMVHGGNSCVLFYPGSMPRPVTKGDVMEKAALLVIDTDVEKDFVSIYEVDLLPLEVSYDLQRVEKAKNDQLRKQELRLAAAELHEAVRSIAPDGERRTAYDIIRDNKQLSIEVRDKALQYLESVGKQAK